MRRQTSGEILVDITLFLGAGFSAPAGLPLGDSLFAVQPASHKAAAAEDIHQVLEEYQRWRATNPTARTELFVSSVHDAHERYLLEGEHAQLWPRLVRFLALRLATPFATFYTYEDRVSRSRDNIYEYAIHPVHQDWWAAVLAAAGDDGRVAVITTNWDVLIERALRPRPRKIAPKSPGFNYGAGPERLKASSGYPKSYWRDNPVVEGSIPLLKLHGSLNWAIEDRQLVKYGDLRPAFRGDAAIVPPTMYKSPPAWAETIWQQAHGALESAECIVVVGYSFPPYDMRVHELFQHGLASSNAPVHVFSPESPAQCERLRTLLVGHALIPHPPLPEGTADLAGLGHR